MPAVTTVVVPVCSVNGWRLALVAAAGYHSRMRSGRWAAGVVGAARRSNNMVPTLNGPVGGGSRTLAAAGVAMTHPATPTATTSTTSPHHRRGVIRILI
jgi:hypothetical protein